MEDRSLTQYLRRLERLIYNIKPVRELNTLTKQQQEIVIAVRDNINLARVQVEFSLADKSTKARYEGLRLAIGQLEIVNKGVIAAGTEGLLSSVDVSQLSAMANLCVDRIEAMLVK